MSTQLWFFITNKQQNSEWFKNSKSKFKDNLSGRCKYNNHFKVSCFYDILYLLNREHIPIVWEIKYFDFYTYENV